LSLSKRIKKNKKRFVVVHFAFVQTMKFRRRIDSSSNRLSIYRSTHAIVYRRLLLQQHQQSVIHTFEAYFLVKNFDICMDVQLSSIICIGIKHDIAKFDNFRNIFVSLFDIGLEKPQAFVRFMFYSGRCRDAMNWRRFTIEMYSKAIRSRIVFDSSKWAIHETKL
jgi:hypothetical protein